GYRIAGLVSGGRARRNLSRTRSRLMRRRVLAEAVRTSGGLRRVPSGETPSPALRGLRRVSEDQKKTRGAAGRFKHLPRPPAPWRGLALLARAGRDVDAT